MSKNLKRLILATIIGFILLLALFLVVFKILPDIIGAIIIIILGILKLIDLVEFLTELIVDDLILKN